MPFRKGRLVCGICWGNPRDKGCPNCWWYMNMEWSREIIAVEDTVDANKGALKIQDRVKPSAGT